MPATRPRRSQAERTAATTGALLDAARGLLAADGFAATSLDAVCAAAGVTKGALYHHFDGKRELFAAVFAREQEALHAAMVEAGARRKDEWAAVEAGCLAFLDACQDPGVQRIVLLDAPAALGWEGIRAAEAGTLATLVAAIGRAMAAGRVPRRPAEPLAHLLFGAICEGAMVVARAADPAAEHRRMQAEIRRLLRALAS